MITKIHTIMKKYIKYICAVLLIIGTSASAWGKTYQRVTNWDQLSNGDVVILANTGADGTAYVLTDSKSGSTYEVAEVTVSSGKITTTSAWELKIKFNSNGYYCAFCVEDTYNAGTGYYTSKWLQDTGTKNQLGIKEVSGTTTASSFAGYGTITSNAWSWQANYNGNTPIQNSSKDYKVTLKNGSQTDRALEAYKSGSAWKYFASHEWNTLGACAIFKVACEEPTLTLSPTSKTMTFGDNSNTFTITKTTNSGGTISWTSTNTSVATVAKNGSNNGVVTVVGAGTTTIKCKVAEYTSGGTTYCEKEVSFTLTVNPACPTLAKGESTQALTASSITSTSAVLSGGIVTYKGGANLTAYGFVYGTSTNPTTSNSTANVGANININTAFGSKTISGLTPNTTYYVRVYGTNGCGTRYSPDGTEGYITFTTLQRYTISYDNNGGGGTISSQYKDHGATATLNSGSSFSKDGYTLSGWNTASGGGGDSYSLGGSYTANANATMYAVWTPNPYTITLDNQTPTTASTPTSINVTFDANTNLTGTVVTTLPTKTGYTFNGYYTGKNGTGVQIITAAGVVNASANDGGSNTYTDASKNWKYANDLTVYAYWTANTINLTLDKNGGDADGSATVKYDATTLTSISHATRSEWNLVGYYAEAGCTHKVLTNTGALVNYTGYVVDGKWARTTTPTTLYAKWSKVQYTVTFNMNGHGDQVEAQDVESGDPAIRPTPDPSEEDWRFLGWFDASSGGSEWNFSTGITGNTTIYAHWEEIEYNTGTYKAWCEPDISITGDIHLTSVNGIQVYSTSTTSNLLNISSTDLAGVEKLEIKYLDADNGDAEVASSSSLFRLCNDGTVNYNVADGTQIDVSGSNTCNLNYSIRYTPNTAGVINHYKIQVAMKCGSGPGVRTLKTVTHDVYGRSLPAEFVVASKFGDVWYALPNTLENLEANAKAVEGIRITVNNTTTPTAALYAPDIAVYSGEGRNAAETNVYAIRLTDGTNHLQVSTTGSKNIMWLSPTGSAACQDWWLSSTNFGAYSVTMPSNTGNESKKIGMYGGNIGYFASPTSPSGEIYFLPITNKLIDVPATVTEWGQKSMVIDVDAQTASAASVHFGDRASAEESSSFGQTLTSVKSAASKYNYTVSFSTTDFSAHKDELLYIDWLDAEDNVIGSSSLMIPWIIAESRDMYKTGETTKGPWNTEVHVLPGVTLTANTDSYSPSGATIKELNIYPGATVKVTTGTLTATNLVLRYGWSRATSKRYDVARLYVTPSTATLKATRAYADWYIDYDQYYPIAVPWNVTVSGISYLNTTNSASGAVKFLYYDGESRADGIGSPANGDNWKTLSPSTLEPSKGYAMTARRPTGKAFSIVRMPLTLPSGSWASGSWTTNGEQGYVSSTHKDQVAVTGYGHGSVEWYNMGWNFIGNPYMAVFNGDDDGISGKLEDQEGKGVRYATIPTEDFRDFEQVPIASANLKPASGFFIQANSADAQTITFAAAKTSVPSAPARYTRVQETIPDQEAYIRLSDGGSKDQMGLIIGEDYTEAYDPDADLTKALGGANTIKTYMHYADMDMAYLAINETLAKEWIPVTVQIPSDGDYYYSLTNSSSVDELEGVYLKDYQTGVVTNLITDNYQFYSTEGIYTERFSINAIVGKRDTPTAIDATDTRTDTTKPVKFLYHDKIYIMLNGVIYDATGKKVREINK